MPVRKTTKYARKPVRKYVRKSRAKTAARPVAYSVKKYVKTAIARVAEMKYASPETYENIPILSIPASSSTPAWFSPSIGSVFGTILQGTGQGQRVGNEITVKSWIIRGALTQTIMTGAVALGSQTLYVDVYIGYRKDYEDILDTLPDLYQNGNASLNPTGLFSDLTQWINKDEYTVLFHRRFKVGNNSNNNDFDLAKTFSFNITSKDLKNANVKYKDATTAVQNAKINAMTIWATCSNGNGTDIPIASDPSEQRSSYAITFTSNVMYTDV